MSYFDIDTIGLKNIEGSFTEIGNRLENCSQDIQSVSSSLQSILSSGAEVGNVLNRLSERVFNQADSFRQIGRGINTISSLYSSTDKDIAGRRSGNTSGSNNGPKGGGNGPKGGSSGKGKAQAGGSGSPGGNRADNPSAPGKNKGTWGRISGKKAEGSLIDAKVSGSSGIISGSAGVGILNGKAETKGGIKAKYKNGRIEEASIGVTGSAEGSLVKGKAEGSIGFIKGKVKGDIGKVSAKGEIGAGLYKNGKFSPGVRAKAEVKAEAVSGEISGQAGSDKNNLNVSAKGSAGVAQASAEGQIGVITYKDPNTGKLKQGVGAQGKVGAEAYVAEGTVSGGITIMGIKFKASVTGKIGGAGIGAEGRIGSGGVSGEIKAGFGAGGGVKIDIDWTDFKWPWKWW